MPVQCPCNASPARTSHLGLYWFANKRSGMRYSGGSAAPQAMINNCGFAAQISIEQGTVRSTKMPLDLPKTTSKRDGPLVKQFSVFLANKVGAMLDVVKLLNAHSCDVVAMSVSESTDSAIARLVVSDPAGVEKLFRQNNIAFGMCEVLVVEMSEVATELAKLLAALFMAEVNVHFTYSLLMRPHGQAALALHVDDNECAISVLTGEGFQLLSQSDISR
jgi:hypothetical protein